MKYKIGETVYLEGKIDKAIVGKDGASYFIEIENNDTPVCWGNDRILRTEDALADMDFVPLEVYEKEVNRLKGIIEELRRMP